MDVEKPSLSKESERGRLLAQCEPSSQLASDGAPSGSPVWTLPVTSYPAKVLSEKSDKEKLLVLLDDNIKSLDDAFTEFARQQALSSRPSTIKAHLWRQAISILRELRDVAAIL